MLSPQRRPRTVMAATITVASLALLAGCSSGPGKATALQASPGSRVSLPASSGPVPDLGAMAAVGKAITATKALRSYAFHASQQLTGGAGAQQTVLIGKVIRPGSVSYTLTVGGQTQQVINLAGRTYLRRPPGSWKALANPKSAVDPVASLLPLLTALAQPTLVGNVLRGTVPANVLTASGLAPAGTTDRTGIANTPVTFTLDGAGQVTDLALRIVVKAGAKTLTVQQATSFSLFDAVPAIVAPGRIT